AWGRDGGHGGGFVADGAQAPGDGGGGSGPAKDLTGGGGAFGGGGGFGRSLFGTGGTGGGGGAGAGGGKGGSARPAAGVTNAGGRGGDGGFGGGGGVGGGLSGGLGDAGTVPGVGGAGGFGGGGGGGGAGLVASRVSIGAGGVAGGSGGYGGGGGGGSSGVVEVKEGSGGGGAGMGGVVFNHAGTLTIVNCTLSGNRAIGGDSATDDVFGGGGGMGLGGAIFNLNGHVLVSHATVFDNGVKGGSGRVSGGGELSESLYNVLHTTGVGLSITGGTGTLVVRNTIVDRCVNDDGEVTLEGHTLIVTSEVCGTPTSTAAPELSPLADNGGPSETRAPSATSIVLHAADPAYCRDGTSTGAGQTDQRGFPRRPGTCDLGAFEEQASALAVVSGDDQQALPGAALGEPLVVRATRELADEPMGGVAVTFTGPGSGAGIAAFSPSAVTTTDEDGEAAVGGTVRDALGTFVVTASAGPASVELTVEVRSVCGDGLVTIGETCDDGGADDPGCAATCLTEDGWSCEGEPSICTRTEAETGAEHLETEAETGVEQDQAEGTGAETADEGPTKSSGSDDGCAGSSPGPIGLAFVIGIVALACARRRHDVARGR
ncbi:MAG: hypothetical protein IT385_10775, partial [Deltaproteobacteria bacterium]|nr:hypothetical protein [Deltaproteobacteria bacterium]